MPSYGMLTTSSRLVKSFSYRFYVSELLVTAAFDSCAIALDIRDEEKYVAWKSINNVKVKTQTTFLSLYTRANTLETKKDVVSPTVLT